MTDSSQQPMTAAADPRPRTFDEAFRAMQPHPEDLRALDDPAAAHGAPGGPHEADDDEEPPRPPTLREQFAAATSQEAPATDAPDAIPDWVQFPPNFSIPPGKQVAFIRLRARWTDRVHLGDRVVILWSLSVADEKLASKRAAGDSGRIIGEMAKQCVRAIDGRVADWTGASGTAKARAGQVVTGGYDINAFWEEIGPRCRAMIQNYYLQTHILPQEEQADFFMNCMIVRSAVT